MLDFVNGDKFQLVLHRLYGFGASIVMIGALFKLQHWPYAGVMLCIGMMTECIIFFFSAFESRAKNYKWENVYPELEGGQSLTSHTRVAATPVAPAINPYNTGLSATPLDLGIDSIQVANIKEGVNRLSSSINHLTSLASVAEESQKLTTNLINANQAVNAVSNTSTVLNNAYNATAQIFSNLNEESQRSLNGMKGITNTFGDQMNSLARNIGAMNSSFELQLKDNQQYQQTYSALNQQITSLVNDVKRSVESSSMLSNQMTALTDNVSRLNSVYGNMLSAIGSNLK